MKRDLIGRLLLDGIEYTDQRPLLMIFCAVVCILAGAAITYPT